MLCLKNICALFSYMTLGKKEYVCIYLNKKTERYEKGGIRKEERWMKIIWICVLYSFNFLILMFYILKEQKVNYKE